MLLWAVDLEYTHNTRVSLDKVLEVVIKCLYMEIFWLVHTKEKWLSVLIKCVAKWGIS